MFVRRFESNRTLLNRHLSLSDASASVRYICLEDCRHDYICRQRNAVYDKYTECVDSFNGTRIGDLIGDLIRPANTTPSATTTLLAGSSTDFTSGSKAGALYMNVFLLACIAALCIVGWGHSIYAIGLHLDWSRNYFFTLLCTMTAELVSVIC